MGIDSADFLPIYFLHRELLTCASSDFARADCKVELRGPEDNRRQMGEHACDYLSCRNALSAIKRIINKSAGSTEEACARCGDKCECSADTFIKHGKSFDKLLSWKTRHARYTAEQRGNKLPKLCEVLS